MASLLERSGDKSSVFKWKSLESADDDYIFLCDVKIVVPSHFAVVKICVIAIVIVNLINIIEQTLDLCG